MADNSHGVKPEAVDTALGDMKLEEEDSPMRNGFTNGTYEKAPTPGYSNKSRSSTPPITNSRSQSPVTKQIASQSPESGDGQEIIGSEITVVVEDGKPPKLSRKASQKIISRPAPLFNDLPDATEEATSQFAVIKDCEYGSKNMGLSEHDSLDCDCSPEYSDSKNHACAEDSDCINRATKMECVDNNCNCGNDCQNQRFQRKQYANVSVIKTEQKGYGLRANTDLKAHDFIFEYIGEVINSAVFNKRRYQYDDEGIKHFYFMSLTIREFVDATKKGNLGRFCNHSCNPNCYVDKWVVGERLRMGIFAERDIKAGEELVFNYNVDRYGADPQVCYCGEPNCVGFIGGKTQTERATKLHHTTIEALGIDDGDGWDTAVAKRPRKKKTGENDEEYVSSVQPRGLDEEGVTNIMATLLTCQEKWIVVKLLSRIQRCEDDSIRNKVVQTHGYDIMRTSLTTWKDDNNVVLQILDILYKFPRITRNKITKAKIEGTVQTFTTSEHEDVAFEAKRLIEVWSQLKEEYRITKKKVDPNAARIFERRNNERVEEVSKSPATPAVTLPTGPRSNVPQRTFIPQRPPIRRPFGALPTGWFAAMDASGNPYYYSKSGHTTWQRPNLPAPQPPPPPKVQESVQKQKKLQDIINGIISEPASNSTPQSMPTAESTPKEKKKPVDKWRSLPVEKQMKLYENTLFPHIRHVMQKFSKLLPKDDLKKFAKDLGKKLVASDFKNNRVDDPTKISEKQEKKGQEIHKKKREKLANGSSSHASSSFTNGKPEAAPSPEPEVEDEVEFSDHGTPTPIPDSPSIPPATPVTGSSSDLKRKRDEDDEEVLPDETEDSESKRLKESPNDDADAPPPPPPPPPPAGGLPGTFEGAEGELLEGEPISMIYGPPLPQDQPIHVGLEEERELRQQEEDRMRENEEAVLMNMDGAGAGAGALGEVNGNGIKDVEMAGTEKVTDLAVRQQGQEREQEPVQ
ncbi:Histone-lysine N-methyltransferase,H3 lysine-36 specific [Lachnellula subtilissima]|uniref:Histone-lysine N-methyltransferase, H3 lysine-36 specific n=1 Tax=Lachnellula subtilissima TaxID=602034 RepID=A0A8H8U9Y8_9HELO|nr:Histone-lysine N-methyltransferase,H3 lysine-36 specific [Lachnellula subtilissima]